MKRILIVALTAVGMVGMSAQAAFFIQWQNTGTGITLDGTTDTPITPNIGDTVLLQLVYAGVDGTADASLFPNWTTDGDDMVLMEAFHENTEGNTGGQYGFFQQVYGGEDTPYQGEGHVYVRVFDSATPGGGSSFYASPVIQVDDVVFGGPGSPTPVVANPFPSGLVALDQTVVPEPMSLAMLAVGALTLMVRHRRRS